ncbi:MAG TPA: bifunctional diaminohydroxyphosphoribosylaminopyrimidine deaminase/5-amino-6-(5-phosphoribosylamino)uracil reductase RibD [bacterium]|nr:bifunctional diaminohydroxyphosphoribosylaminopyrimidine deaminase/5-amino-6-(5-phosphoribosylamino)uracil reductase RibD [bacterium]
MSQPALHPSHAAGGVRPASGDDRRFLGRALELAARARGRTSPNPLVGAVLVKDGEVVGEGWHVRAGEPHAEAIALAKAGDAARGATLYVTLEPCSHRGRTGPCAPAVAAAEVARVVSAMEDPDPRVRGGGHELLREAGVRVEVGMLAEEAERLNAEYLHRVRTGRAFGVLKAAVTLDGRLAADGGDSRWITGEEARARAHELRDRYDAVMIGRGTLERDDPRLDVRIPGDRRDPVVVVVDSALSGPPVRNLWDRAKDGAQVIVASTDRAPEDREATLRDHGVEVLRTDASPEGRVALPELFGRLAERGLNSVLIEGGEALHTAALAAGVIERAHVFVAPVILGGNEGPRLVGDLGFRRVADGVRLRDVEVETLGEDVLVSGSVAFSAAAAPGSSPNGGKDS